MGDTTSTETTDDREPADPYGDVALGVECAWPQSIPFSEAMSIDTE